jgi:transposase
MIGAHWVGRSKFDRITCPTGLFRRDPFHPCSFFIRLSLLLLLCGSSIGQQYFPEGVFDEEKQANDSIVGWYSGHLKALQEPSLWEISKKTKGPVFRFLWLRSFDHPVVVRLNVSGDGTGTLVTKISGRQGGYEPGKLVENRTKKLSKQETQWFLDRVEELKYWELPGREEKAPNVVNLDGAHWVVEAVRDGNYKLVDRWSPQNGPIKAIGTMMTIDLAKTKLLYQDVY